MEIIKKLSEQIAEEVEGAEWYAKNALKYREAYPTLARVLFDISTEELRHVDLLHGEVVKIIEDYRKKNGDPPPSMLSVYDYLHEKQIEEYNEVKMYQGQYRGAT